MNRLNRKIDSLGLSLGHGAILVSVVLIVGMLLIATAGVFVKSVNLPNEPYRISTQHLYVMQDSVKDLPKDSLMTFSQRIEILDKKVDEALSDLRQEGNNNINKINGWLGFWIAILTIFGGIVPMVLQYVLRRKSKREVEELFDRISDKIENTRMQVVVSCMNASLRPSIISNSTHRNQFLLMYAQEAYTSFCEIIDRIEAEDGRLTQDDEVSLLAALIQYCKLMDGIMNCLTGRKVRQMRNLRNEVRALIVDILNHFNHSRYEIWARLLDLKPKLSSIPLPD